MAVRIERSSTEKSWRPVTRPARTLGRWCRRGLEVVSDGAQESAGEEGAELRQGPAQRLWRERQELPQEHPAEQAHTQPRRPASRTPSTVHRDWSRRRHGGGQQPDLGLLDHLRDDDGTSRGGQYLVFEQAEV